MGNSDYSNKGSSESRETLQLEIRDDYGLLTDDEIELINNFCDAAYALIDVDKDMEGNEHSVQFWACLSTNLFKKRYEYIQAQTELERQKLDLEHFSTKCDDTNSAEYMEMLKEIGAIVRKRRIVKDIVSYLNVATENINRIAGFICNMTERKYSPRSVKYGHSDDIEQTTVKINNIKQIATNKK